MEETARFKMNGIKIAYINRQVQRIQQESPAAVSDGRKARAASRNRRQNARGVLNKAGAGIRESRKNEGGIFVDYNKMALEMHEKNQGKLGTYCKVELKTKDDLSTAYTPGVAEPCRKIADNPDDIYKYTFKGNMVAVVSDGSAVLGLGNIGGAASMPVMEGKCVLFKAFSGVDAFPICLATQDDEEIIKIVQSLEPVFGGINLEDINAPRCFYIEEQLKKTMNIPVFHDDQHGTAIVVSAALLNALKYVGKNIGDIKITINGAGSAAIAVAKLIMGFGVKNLIICDSKGIIYEGRKEGMNPYKDQMAKVTNRAKIQGGLKEAVVGADVFIGLSKAHVLSQDMVKTMAPKPLIFAMANPTPEIMPDEAKAAGAVVVATGRSDFPNQINNVLAFPGVFKGAFEVRASDINEEMKIAAAVALAGMIKTEDIGPENILPPALDRNVAKVVAAAVAKAARDSGVARI
jgi:malate dehydrogenase (oxaloacetate-decarboxylating)